MNEAAKAIEFLQGLVIPEGPKAGKPIKLAPFQKKFVRGALKKSTNVAVLSIGRGNGKSALSAGIALGALLGVWDSQPRREIVIAARTAEQARIAYSFVVGFIQGLPEDERALFVMRKSPRLEIEYDGDGGGHIIKAISSDGRSSLGSAPNLVLMDERAHWKTGRGEELEAALLSGLGKRGGRAIIISTSADNDMHPFSQWLDNPEPGIYIQEHRAEPGLPADDRESLIAANPGARYGIGSSIKWLEQEARRAIARGGSTLTSFRLYNRNERVSGEERDVLLTVDEWMQCETDTLPERSGPCVVGIDLGESASMTAVAFYWPQTGRLESLATFPTDPNLADRGQRDGVGKRYVEMQERNELNVMGNKTVPIDEWLLRIMMHVDGEKVSCLIADRFKQSFLTDAINKAGLTKTPVVWRGTGWKDGNEDVERFRRAVFDGMVKAVPSLLLRSAIADAVVLKDPANNSKLAKGRSSGRIDAIQAGVIAVAEGVRQVSRTRKPSKAPTWL